MDKTEKEREDKVVHECMQLKRRVLEHHGGRIVGNMAELMDALVCARRLTEKRPEAFGLEGGHGARILNQMTDMLRSMMASYAVYMQRHGATAEQLSIFVEINECSGWICHLCGCTTTESCVEVAEPFTIEADDPGQPLTCHWVDRDLCSACAGKQEGEG